VDTGLVYEWLKQWKQTVCTKL